MAKTAVSLTDAARKVCTPGCMACFDCGKSKSFATVSPGGTNTVCPLQKYDIEHPSEKKADILARLKNEPNLDELYLLCKHCQHRDTSQDEEDTISMENCFLSHCLDCPVHMCRDAIEECMAEAQSG